MKRYCTKISMFLVLTVVFLAGCREPVNSNGVPITTSVTTFSTTTEMCDRNTFDVYQITGDENFSSFISQNTIDRNYEKEFQNATSTAEFLSIESKYLSIWKEEMLFAESNLSLLLTNSDKEAFSIAQSKWEEGTIGTLMFERSLLENNEEYHVNLGSGYLYLKESEMREAYRQRTMRIKYIHYLLETQTDNPAELTECLSLKLKTEIE